MKELFSFTGRSKRSEYWISQLTYGLLYAVLMISIDSYNDILTAISAIGLLIGFIPIIAIQIKRFHDMDRSGVFILINFVPYIGTVFNMIWLGFLGPVDTIDDSNSYGANPRT